MDGKQEHKVSSRIGAHCHHTDELHFYGFFQEYLTRLYLSHMVLWPHGHKWPFAEHPTKYPHCFGRYFLQIIFGFGYRALRIFFLHFFYME